MIWVVPSKQETAFHIHTKQMKKLFCTFSVWKVDDVATFFKISKSKHFQNLPSSEFNHKSHLYFYTCSYCYILKHSQSMLYR